MRALVLAVSVAAITACGSPVAPTAITTAAPAVPAVASASDHGDGGNESPGTISVRIVSQERTGPCVIHVGRIPTADPDPVPRDGQLFVDLEWCSSRPVNASAEISSSERPDLDFFAGLGEAPGRDDFSAGCHLTRVYWDWPLFLERFDQVHVSVTAGQLHDRASCGLRY